MDLYCAYKVNLEQIKIVYKKTTELELTINLTTACQRLVQSSTNQNLNSAFLIKGDLLYMLYLEKA